MKKRKAGLFYCNLCNSYSLNGSTDTCPTCGSPLENFTENEKSQSEQEEPDTLDDVLELKPCPLSLPDSKKEKEQQWKDNHYLEHWLYVHELKTLLEELEDTDWVTTNQLGNLAVSREGENLVAAIDFHRNRILWFGKYDVEEK